MINFQNPKNNKHKGQHQQPKYHLGGQERPDVFPTQSLHEKVNDGRRAKDREEFDMDGFKHQMAKISAILAWIISIYFSYLGFKFQNQEVQWIGWVLGGLVTCGEFIFNSEIRKLSLTLVVIGIVCYGYGIYSNVVGFWSIQFPNIPFPWFEKEAAMSWFVGAILEVYPEAAFAWGVRAVTGDLVGNVVDMAKGVAMGKRTFMSDSIRERLGK